MKKTIQRCAGLVLLMGGMVAGTFLGGCAAAPSKPPAREYMFWPAAPEEPHIQYLTSISRSGDVTGQQGKMDELLYGKDSRGDLPFNRPYGVRMRDGKIYVCDASAANVSILDFRMKQVRILGRTGQVTLVKPIDLEIAPDGMKYVADTGLGAIIVFDSTDRYAGRISVPDLRPVGVAVFENELFVSDLKGSKVRVFDRLTGKPLRTIGSVGAGPGQIGCAMGVAVDRAGNVYVNDVIGCRVQKFTRDGKFIASLGGLGDYRGAFVRPKLMTVDSTGILYVVDEAFQNVQMFDDQRRLLLDFGKNGTHPGAMDMPAGICVTDSDLDLFASYVHPAFQVERLIIVTNNYGANKINIYALGHLAPGKTVADVAAGRIKVLTGVTDKPATFGLNVGTTQPASVPASAPVGPAPAP